MFVNIVKNVWSGGHLPTGKTNLSRFMQYKKKTIKEASTEKGEIQESFLERKSQGLKGLWQECRKMNKSKG